MAETVIHVENVSKEYRLGMVGSKTLSADINRLWAKIRGKEDPSLKIGTENRLDIVDGEYIWALKDINFEVKQGEVLGIIGKNGAGKSTLLKILSKVTAPTTGSVKIKGRIASLLEVGTGFHPELTGRENIFLNGAILGMTKTEIRSKFDEIVTFSGVEKYIDTPVKRYSSGMYVRLAFAVAAHLDPEILIVDEVLAVGDAEFQKKALGKMQDLSSGRGRTVLFVSHNMGAIKTLCEKSMLLENGIIREIGLSDKIISRYFKSVNKNTGTMVTWNDPLQRPGDDYAELISCRITDENNEDVDTIKTASPIGVEIVYNIKKEGAKPKANIFIRTNDGTKVFQTLDTNSDTYKPGEYKSVCKIPGNFLNDESYIMQICLTTYHPVVIHCSCELFFDVIDDFNYQTRGEYIGKMHGVMRPLLEWETEYNS